MPNSSRRAVHAERSEAPSSSGQDAGFSTQKPEFDSPWRHHRIKKILVPGILILAALLVAGGFYFRQRSLDLTSQTIVPEEEGEVSGARTNLPENFPPDIPLFEPAEVLSSLESKERIQTTLQTNTPSERVQKFYQQEMKEQGWRLTGRGAANDNGVLTFLKDDRAAQVVITSEPTSPTLIILSTAP